MNESTEPKVKARIKSFNPLTRTDVEQMLVLACQNARGIKNTIRQYEALISSFAGKVYDKRREHYKRVIEKAKKKLEEEQYWIRTYTKVLNPNYPSHVQEEI